MNNIKSGEVMKLKDLISYEEGSIANLDVVVPLTGNLPTLRRYFRLTYYPHLQRGGLLYSGLLFVHRANKRGDLSRFSGVPSNRANEKGLSARWRHNFFTSTKVTDYKGLSTRL